jgi:hypothetical protein
MWQKVFRDYFLTSLKNHIESKFFLIDLKKIQKNSKKCMNENKF